MSFGPLLLVFHALDAITRRLHIDISSINHESHRRIGFAHALTLFRAMAARKESPDDRNDEKQGERESQHTTTSDTSDSREQQEEAVWYYNSGTKNTSSKHEEQ